MIGSFSESPRNSRRTVVRATESAPSDRGDDREVVAVLQRRLEPGSEPNVFVVAVDVDELAQLALVVVESLPKTRELLVELVERLRDVAGIALDDRRATRELPERAGHTD